jgi:translation initiation factor 2B subunit (eIF-2B alpha/beta/delta family)
MKLKLTDYPRSLFAGFAGSSWCKFSIDGGKGNPVSGDNITMHVAIKPYKVSISTLPQTGFNGVYHVSIDVKFGDGAFIGLRRVSAIPGDLDATAFLTEIHSGILPLGYSDNADVAEYITAMLSAISEEIKSIATAAKAEAKEAAKAAADRKALLTLGASPGQTAVLPLSDHETVAPRPAR